MDNKRMLAIRMMAVFIMIVSLFPAVQVCAAEPEPPIVRSAVHPQTEIWVGQRVLLQVDVLIRDGWAKIKRISDFEVPGAYRVRLETQGVRLNETVDGSEYTGQRYEMSLFPQRGGTITVPPMDAELELSQWGEKAGKSSQPVQIPGVAFEAKVPPGAEKLPGIISTTEFTARQQWDSDSLKFTVGEAVKRTIELSAEDVSAMAFAPLVFSRIDGLGVYTVEPIVEDSYVRGSLKGKRIEVVTYVFEREGSFELPEVTIWWWDLGRKALQKNVLPSLQASVSGGPSSGNDSAVDDAAEIAGQTGTRMLLSGIVFLIFLAVVAWRFRAPLQSRWQTWKRDRNLTEKAYFKRLGEACRRNDAKASYNHLMAWLNRQAPGGSAASLRQFLDVADSATLATAVGELESELFRKVAEDKKQTAWSGRELYNELIRCRRNLIRTKAARFSPRRHLAQLIPG
jgi:hypothetical protein